MNFSKQIVQKHQVKAQRNEHDLSEEQGELLTDGDISQTPTHVNFPVADNDIKQKDIVTIQDIIQAPIIIIVPPEASADANIVLEFSGIEIDNFPLCNLDSSLLDVTVENLIVDMLLDL
ncbi:hypothetical protein JTB14_007644 [Gonioctena quinquepunctata]|nr:hypothetical protein JTB14_007644 [Gonioctena quinquepunctata]